MSPDEQDRVFGWRFEELDRVGYAAKAAEELAESYDVDLHEAIALKQRGCDDAIALRILLP